PYFCWANASAEFLLFLLGQRFSRISVGPTLQPSRCCARRKISKLLEPGYFFVLAPSFPAESSALRRLGNRATEERADRERWRLASLRGAWAGMSARANTLSACARYSFLTAFTVAAEADTVRCQSLVFVARPTATSRMQEQKQDSKPRS